MNKFILVIFILLLGVACSSPRVSPPVIPCPYLSDFPLVSTNPCLNGPYGTNTSNTVVQAIPDGWQIKNNLVNADGYKDEWSQATYIIPNEMGLEVWLNNGVVGINGHTQFVQSIELEPGCHLGKGDIFGRNNDPPHADNFALSFFLDDELVSQQILPLQGAKELIYPFVIETSGSYKVTFSIDVLWATSGHNGHIVLRALGVMRVPNDYCQ